MKVFRAVTAALVLSAVSLTSLASSRHKVDVRNSAVITINSSDVSHVHQGWGVSLCWWAHMTGMWSQENVDTIVDWLVSPQGLNYNVFRYNIGGGDDPLNRNCYPHHMADPKNKGKGIRAEIPGFKASEDAPYDFQADSSQIRILQEILKRRPDAIVEAFSNSAPWWMTVSGCCGGNEDPLKDNVAPERYSDFADYLVDVCSYFRDSLGVVFHSLEPFNEPLTKYWYKAGTQEGCHFDALSQAAFLKVLAPRMAARNPETIISASDETNTKDSNTAFDAYRDAGVLDLIGQWNTHTYAATNAERIALREKASAAGLRLWQSESGSGGKGIEGNLKLLQRLIDDEKYLKPDVWCDWQYIEERGDQWSTVTGSFSAQNYRRNKNFSVRSHATRFIPAGSKFLSVEDASTLAALTPEGRLVIVHINNSVEQVTRTFALCSDPAKSARNAAKGFSGKVTSYLTTAHCDLQESALKANREGRVCVTLPAHSVVTLVY